MLNQHVRIGAALCDAARDIMTGGMPLYLQEYFGKLPNHSHKVWARRRNMRRAMVGLVALVAVVVILGCGSEDLVEIPYNPDFTSLVTEGKVIQVEIIQEPSGVTYIRGETKPGESPGKFKVYVAAADRNLSQFLTSNNVQFTVSLENPSAWQCMSSVLPVLLVGMMSLVWIAIIIFVLTLAVRLVRAVERIADNTKKE